MKKLSLFVVATLLMLTQVWAQLETPQPSPLSTTSQKVGLADVTVEYSRPSMRGREVMGALVPYNELWRTGANRATKVTFSDEMSVAGNQVPAGDYALFSIPGEQEWTVIFNKNTDQGGTGSYQEAEDALRVKVPVTKTDNTYEAFTIDFSDLGQATANMNLMWENTKVVIPIEDPSVDQKVMAQIEEQMANMGTDANANANLYFQAANYYFMNDKDLEQAEEWIGQAVAGDDVKFWMKHLQAKIYAKQKEYDQAKEAAQQSMELAKENGNQDYVRLNEELLESMN